MSLQIYIDNKALFEYFGWPEGMVRFANTGRFIDPLVERSFREPHALAILRDHCWKIIRDRWLFEYEWDGKEHCLDFHYDRKKDEYGWKAFERMADLDELHVACLQWILEQEKNDG